MQFICELIPSSYLTPLRRALAIKLSEYGLTQVEIANKLGISQPVVSSYLKNPQYPKTSLINRSKFNELVVDLFSRIKEESSIKLDLMDIICKRCQDFRTAGPLCEIHRKKTNLNFAVDCKICFPEADSIPLFEDKLKVTRELYNAAKSLIELEDRFGLLIPEIGCQFVYSTENFQSNDDIAGYPGRIVKFKGRGRIISYPEFGQGSLLSKILLLFKEKGSKYRSLISIRNTDEIYEKISKSKVIISTKEGDKDWETTLNSFSKDQILQAEIIVDEGGVGFEPITYIFGLTPTSILQDIEKLF